MTFVRIAGVVRMTGLGRSTIYRLMAEDKFPPPVRLAKRAVAWRRVDLEQWSAARPHLALMMHFAAALSAPTAACYIVIDSLRTMPMSSIPVTTLPQSEVVNQ